MSGERLKPKRPLINSVAEAFHMNNNVQTLTDRQQMLLNVFDTCNSVVI